MRTLSGKVGPGLAASMLLHGLLVGGFLMQWPFDPSSSPPAETVDVKMVPEPEPPPEKPPENKKPSAPPPKPAPSAPKPVEAKQPAPAEQRAAAFESASSDSGTKPASGAPSPPQATPEPAVPPDSKPVAQPAEPPEGAQPPAQPEPIRTDTTPPVVPDETPTVRLPDLTLPETTRSLALLPEPDTQSAPPPQPEAASVIPRPRPARANDAEAQRQPEMASAPSAIPAPSVDLAPAKALYSEDVLSNPRLRQALGKLPPDRRIVQICSIEALEQIRHARPGAAPDFLAFPETGRVVSVDRLTVQGGAFRSRQVWYDIDFQCTVDPATNSVRAFRFAVGKAVPESDWGPRKLPRD